MQASQQQLGCDAALAGDMCAAGQHMECSWLVVEALRHRVSLLPTALAALASFVL
jgi:hypothetical protein